MDAVLEIRREPLYPFAWGSQTVYSTTTDYAKFLKMMMNGGRVGDRQLLSPAAVARMLEPVSQMKMMGSDDTAPTGFQGLEVILRSNDGYASRHWTEKRETGHHRT